MPDLFASIYGCLAASRIGSAMGAAVEGWAREKVADAYGYVDRMYPYQHYQYRGIEWQRPAGTTEDGIERQKLLVQAIVDRQDRITVEDFAQAAIDACDLEKMLYMTEPDDVRLIRFIKDGVPAALVGTLTNWSGLISVARASHPIGLINAGDPAGADRDVRDVGRFCFAPNDVSHEWSSVYVAAIAEAVRPEATVASVIEVARRFVSDRIRKQFEFALDCAEAQPQYEAMRDAFDKVYSSRAGEYPLSSAGEVVSKGFAVFVRAKGDARQAVLDAVNFGRDTDCLAAIAGGLAGALTGVESLPDEWIAQVDEATMMNSYTNRQTTIREDAEGIFGALRARAKRMRELVKLIEG